MKITDIVIHITRGEMGPLWPRPHRFRAEGERVYAAFIRLVAEDGSEGYAALGSMPIMGKDFSLNLVRSRASQVVGLIKQELLGRSVFDREWLWTQRYVYAWWGHCDPVTVSAVDLAMWDLAGRILDQPVHRLLGGCREKVPAYSSGPWYPNDEDHAALAAKSKALGYPAFKIKPGGGPLERVKRIATQVREAVGDDMELMLDGQARFDYQEALSLGRHLQDLNYKWFEDPVEHTDFAALERLGRRLEIPIAWCDHRFARFHELTDWIRRPGGPTIFRGDCGKDGLTGLKKLSTVADAFGMKCELHGSSMGNLQVIHAVGNCDYFEDCLGGALDALDTNLRRRDPSDPLYVGEDGCVRAPSFPGVTPAPDLDDVDNRTVEVLR